MEPKVTTVVEAYNLEILEKNKLFAHVRDESGEENWVLIDMLGLEPKLSDPDYLQQILCDYYVNEEWMAMAWEHERKRKISA